MPSSTSEADWSFLYRPRWLLSHLFVIVLIVGMIGAGFWQLSRHGERADRNDVIRDRGERVARPIEEIAGPDATPQVGRDERFRRVTVVGEYLVDDEVRVRNRSSEGTPGTWVLTPLITDDGWAVVVNRGFVPRLAGVPDVAAPPPTGSVTIAGFVQPTRPPEGLERADPAEGRLDSLARPDIERLAQQLDYEVLPLWVQLEDDVQDASRPEPPWPIPLPTLDGGPHLSYAVQWFIFATIAFVGYPLILRRKALGRAESLPGGVDPVGHE